MARGDGESINLETDTFKVGIIDMITPAQDTANPTWDATSSQDYDGNKVSTVGGYAATGNTLKYRLYSYESQ
jgi:hypothetical protein